MFPLFDALEDAVLEHRNDGSDAQVDALLEVLAAPAEAITKRIGAKLEERLRTEWPNTDWSAYAGIGEGMAIGALAALAEVAREPLDK